MLVIICKSLACSCNFPQATENVLCIQLSSDTCLQRLILRAVFCSFGSFAVNVQMKMHSKTVINTTKIK